MFEMICLFGYTLNIVYAFETTWTQLIAFYVGSSFFWVDLPNSPYLAQTFEVLVQTLILSSLPIEYLLLSITSGYRIYCQ